MGRAKKATNPYRTGETVYWTENFYDSAGRLFKIKTPDNAEVTTNYGLSNAVGYLGTTVTVTDQAGKQRRSITNGLGQLKRVDEPTINGLGAINTPNQPTYYEYDTLSNLTKVKQGGTETAPEQTRSFAYDSLSRLKSAANPESGLIQYSYDNNGNLTSKIDARNITTSYVYDALNRITQRSYAGETTTPATPTVNYFYDNLPNAKGKLIKVDNGTSKTEYQIFDTMGRVTQSQQTTGGVTYGDPMEYIYNLSGALVEQKYPSGRVVKTTLDADGMLAQVQSKKANDTFRNYANSFNYTAAGAVSSVRLGNGKWENTTFNSRLQPIQIGLGSSATDTGLLKLDYQYGTLNWDGTVLAGTNNGNVAKQTITTPTTGRTSGDILTKCYGLR